MKKAILLTFVFVLAMSLVLAVDPQMGSDNYSGQDSEISTGQATQNRAALYGLEIRERVRAGEYINENGEQLRIREENGLRLKAGDIEADSTLELTHEMVQNKIKLQTQLSNGRNAEIKIMPNTASETALARLRLRVCNESNNCTIQLKEVGSNNQTRAAYEVQLERHSRIFGIFAAKMQVQTQVDAENGEVIQTRKPWWAFLATESD